MKEQKERIVKEEESSNESYVISYCLLRQVMTEYLVECPVARICTDPGVNLVLDD
jgi:hypothetical protein